MQTQVNIISLNFGTSFVKNLIPNLKNNVWKMTLNAWIKYVSINQPTKLEHKLTMPLWYNPVLLNDSLVKKTGMKKE